MVASDQNYLNQKMDTKDTAHLSYLTKFCYGVGHVFNDLCASMWFSYLLVYFEKVLEFDSTKAGLVMLVGQLADGMSTPVVGIFSDRENKIPVCANYGRRKVWHLMGTVFVLISFPFIFSPCLGCNDSNVGMELVYYCAFVILFQFGWASVQISHLSLIPELTPKKHVRTELNSIRYAFTVLANLSVYTVAFLVLGYDPSTSTTVPSEQNGFSSYNGSSTIATTTSDFQPDGSAITPADANEFRNMALFCIGAGLFFSAIFHIGVKEPPFKNPGKAITIQKIESSSERNLEVTRMRKVDWFKEIAFFQVAILYMATRLYVNLYQVYVPLYVQDTLKLEKTAVATVPFAMYLAGFVGSLVMKKINKKIGRKGTFALGCLIGLSGCTWVSLGSSDAYKTWGVYCVAALLGIGGSTVLITSLSITADLIGSNVEGGAFVYGFMSLVDKISNGIVIMIIQKAQDSHTSNDLFYKRVITYACGAACTLGLLVAITLIPVKVHHRRGMSKAVAALVEESETEEDSTYNQNSKNSDDESSMSTISTSNMAEDSTSQEDIKKF